MKLATTAPEFGQPVDYDRVQEILANKPSEGVILVLSNPGNEFYYAFKIRAGEGVAAKYGSYSRDLERLKSAPCSARDMVFRNETIGDKLTEKWSKFPKRALYVGPENIDHTWNQLVMRLNGVERQPTKVSATNENKVRGFIAEYKSLIKMRARQNRLDENQLHGAFTGVAFELDKLGCLNNKFVNDLFDNPECLIDGSWRESVTPKEKQVTAPELC